MLAEIKETAQKFFPRLIEIRRHLHANPELSGEERQTSAYISGVLSSCGLKVTEEVGKTGVVGELPGSGTDSRILAIRTDMDALPIQERCGLDFASGNPGIMHACGHDVHATLGLGTAMVLSQLSATLPGNVRFLFQPAEEIALGAKWMVQAGAIEGVDAVYGVHVFPSIPARQIGIRYGALTSAADELEIVIQGESGHGARPHQAIDAIWIASQVITSLQQAISRTQNPLHPIVLSIGKIEGGKAHNIIADRVQMMGTVRSLHPDSHANLPQWITNVVEGVCQTYGAKCQVDYRRGVPPVHNDKKLTQIVESATREAWGDGSIQIIPEPSLGAEDFAVYLEQIPGCMFRLGVGHHNQLNYPLHHPLFNIDEDAILTGVVTMAYAACKYWQEAN
ncbi:MAG: M20 family metallopeptidase [Cyanobacteria bacterium J06621_8]